MGSLIKVMDKVDAIGLWCDENNYVSIRYTSLLYDGYLRIFCASSKIPGRIVSGGFGDPKLSLMWARKPSGLIGMRRVDGPVHSQPSVGPVGPARTGAPSSVDSDYGKTILVTIKKDGNIIVDCEERRAIVGDAWHSHIGSPDFFSSLEGVICKYGLTAVNPK
jgi:hypothetical protein